MRQIQQITNKTPWFAVASAVAHGGEVEYETAQRVADALSKLPPSSFLDPSFGAKAIRTASGGVGIGTRHDVEKSGRHLAEAAKCFISSCARNPREKGTACVTKKVNRDKLYRCLRYGKTGVGVKAADLAREYLGDPEATAVDRHVMNYACSRSDANCMVDYEELRQAERNRLYAAAEKQVRSLPSWSSLSEEARKKEQKRLHTALLRSELYTTRDPSDPKRKALWRRAVAEDGSERFDRIPVRPWVKGDKITPASYAKGQRIIREEAAKLGTTPAAIQVSAWLVGTCRFRTSRRKPGEGWKLSLSAGLPKFDCLKALPKNERDAARKKANAATKTTKKGAKARTATTLGGFTRAELKRLGTLTRVRGSEVFK